MFTASQFDLGAYLARIGYDGERRATRRVLEALVRLHPEAIAFENLNPLSGQPVPLDPRSLQRKLVDEGRGGYCYEHNLLLAHALTALGFDVTGLAARVVWMRPPGTLTPRTHMLLMVRLDGAPHIVDVGFGGLTLTGVLRLEPDIVQQTPHEPFRLRRADGLFTLDAQIRGEWAPLYCFDLQPQFVVDYELSNWYTSSHPASPFVSTLVAARVEADRRYALRNLDFAVHRMDGSTELRVLTTVDQLRRTLEDAFRIRVPASADTEAALARLVSAAQAV